MSYAMLDKPNKRYAQGRPTRRNGARVAGLAVIHSFEIAPDTSGTDSAAERGLNYLQTRKDPGCYHRLNDSDTRIPLYPFEWETWHCRFTNNWSNGFCMATQASAWDRIPAEHAEALMLNCARDVAEFVAWCRDAKNIRVPIRWIDRSAAMRREPGITMHSITDPWRRSDPGFSTARAARFLQMVGDMVNRGGDVAGRDDDRVTLVDDGVKEQQRILTTAGYYRGWVDGIAGPIFKAAVKAYQAGQVWPELHADGHWGPVTDGHAHWTRELQAALNAWRDKWDTRLPRLREDYDYGDVTASMVRAWQVRNHGKAYPRSAAIDGEAGPLTATGLNIRNHP